jgi:hypothetical protein
METTTVQGHWNIFQAIKGNIVIHRTILGYWSHYYQGSDYELVRNITSVKVH